VRDRRAAIQCPLPIGAAIQRVRQAPDFEFFFRVLVEVRGAREHASEEKGRVDRGELALPHPASALHVQEVVVEALVACGIGLRAVRAISEETESSQRYLGRELARDDAVFDQNRNGRERETNSSDAGRRSAKGFVADQAVGRVGLMKVVLDRRELQPVEIAIGQQGLLTLCWRR